MCFVLCRRSVQIHAVLLPVLSVTTEKETQDADRTVPVDVLVTGVSLPVAVRVSLVAVGDVGTVITGVSKRVAVRVLLVFVWDQTAVILRNGGHVRSHDDITTATEYAHSNLHVLDAVSVRVFVTLVPDAVVVGVLLSRVGREPAVVLKDEHTVR